MQQKELGEIKRKSVFGALTLTSRTLILQIIAFVSWYLLGVILDPHTFGIFYIVTAVVNFLNYFSDIGLAAALIQKHTEPTPEDYATTFTIQQSMVFIAMIIALFLTSEVQGFYQLDASGIFLYQALLILFFLSSLKTIPSVILERKLEFNKLVLPQIIESIVFYGTTLILAYRGFGIVSFAWASILRGISGLVTLYILAPWRPRVHLNYENAKRLLSFGLPYQGNSFLALVKDDLLILYLGKVLPLAAVGYIGWAKKWAEIFLRLIMDNLIKITFPAYSRLQESKEVLSRAIERSLLFLALFSFPIATGMLFVVKPFIEITPRYLKWEPAIFSFYLFTISAMLSTLSSPLVNALNALGKVKYTFYLMIMWTVLTWTLVPTLVAQFSFNGVAIAALCISMTSFMPLYFIKKVLPVTILNQIQKPIVATGAMAIVLWGISLLRLPSGLTLTVSILAGGVTYTSLAYFLLRKELAGYLLLFKKRIRG